MPSLNWIGKEAVTQHHKQVPFRMLQPVAELSCGEASNPESENLIVQGYGEAFPKSPTQTTDARNRRVAVRRITPLLRQIAEN